LSLLPLDGMGRIMTAASPLVATLPSIAQLALVYAPAATREQTLALLALDARLAGLIRNSREPMLAQLRLAWWRETLGRDAAEWPAGEPIFAALRSWGGGHQALTALVDGWEALASPPPLERKAMEAFVRGRGEAFAALAKTVGRSADMEAASVLGQTWALEDLPLRLGRDDERAAAMALAQETRRDLPRVHRKLRALRVLAGLTRRRRLTDGSAMPPGAAWHAVKLGLLGL